MAISSILGCATSSYYRPTASNVKETTARNALAQLKSLPIFPLQIFKGNSGLSFLKKFTVSANKEGLIFDIQGEGLVKCPFQSLDPEVMTAPDSFYVYLGPRCDWSLYYYASRKDYAIKLANILYVLKVKAGIPLSPMQEPEFRQAVDDYRSRIISKNLKLSEEARRYRVQAEAAIQERKFSEAEDFMPRH